MIAEEKGGLIRNANLIENLLGFPKGISGKVMLSLMQDSIENFQIPIIYDKIIRVDYNENKFWLKTIQDLEFSCDYLIIGTGTIPKSLEVPGEEQAIKKNLLFYDIHKFMLNEKALHIAIIGSGDAAYDYALNLAKNHHTIEILQRKAQSKALPLLVKRVKETPNIHIKNNNIVKKITVKEDNQLKIDVKTEHGLSEQIFDVIFVTVGRSPNISFLSHELTLYFLEGNEREKFDEKLWFIGDVKNNNYRQLAIAMGDGIRTAMHITTMFHK
jgi:thioredoxin reductase (NADPH)